MRIPTTRVPVLIAAVGALLVVAVPAAPALAHEEEKQVPARTLADEAIAIIRSQPEQTDAIADKVNDATESEDAEGVDKALLEKAKASLDGGDLSQTELLLEEAIGTCPGQPVTEPAGVRKPLKLSAPCPAPAHLQALGRQPITGAAKPTLLAVGTVLALGGLLWPGGSHERHRRHPPPPGRARPPSHRANGSGGRWTSASAYRGCSIPFPNTPTPSPTPSAACR